MPAKEDLMSRINVRFALCLILTCWTAAVIPASAQHFKQIDPSGPQLSYLAAGRSEVWGLHFPGGQIYRLNPSTNKFVQVPGSLSQVAVGGGSRLQPDQVWGVNGAGVFSFNLSTNAYTPHNPPGSTTYFNQIAVGDGDEDALAGGSDGCHPYEVWGLASSVPAYSGLPYRYNYCAGEFDQIPLPYGSTTPFTHIATGGSDVWALDANENIWHLDQFNLPCSCAWKQIPGALQQITVGVNDVWGLDGYGTVYRYDPNNATWVLIQHGDNVSSIYVGQIAAGGDGVWTIDKSTFSEYIDIQRFDSGPQTFFTFAPPFYTPTAQIAVGSGAGVWVVNSSNQVYTWVRP
jgi:tectonin-like protein